MNRLSLRNNRLKFKTSRELPNILGESIEYTSKLKEEITPKDVTYNQLDLETLRS